jgi:hypothetical protein
MITLTTPKNIAINGVTVENDTQGVVTSFSIDFLNNTCTIVLKTGFGAPSFFQIGTYFDETDVVVNLITGAWTSSNGKSGTISGMALTTFLAQIKGDRNLMETFASGNSGIMPGTQQNWI